MSQSPPHVAAGSHFLDPRALMEPYVHVASLPSKDIRGHFVRAVAALLLGLSPRHTRKINTATGVLHSASLVFDDIEDGSVLRRGLPAAHIVFGMPLALNAASAACVAALEVMLLDEEEEAAREAAMLNNSNSSNENDNTGAPPSSSSWMTRTAPSQVGMHGAVSDCVLRSSPTFFFNQHMFASGAGASLSPVCSAAGDDVSEMAAGSGNGNNDIGGGGGGEASSASNTRARMLKQLRHAALSGQLTRIYIDAMRQLFGGQGKDILWRDTQHVPRLDEYRLMARQKTGGLFRLVAMWALELHNFEQAEQLFFAASGGGDSNNNADVETTTTAPSSNNSDNGGVLLSCTSDPRWRRMLFTLCDDFGLCFQVLDDVSNLCDPSLHKLKSFAEDIDEGKYSYPAIHCILRGAAQHPPDTRLFHMLRQHHATAAAAAETRNASGSGLIGEIETPSGLLPEKQQKQHQQQHSSSCHQQQRSIEEKKFCIRLMVDAGSIDASCDEVLNLAVDLKRRAAELARAIVAELDAAKPAAAAAAALVGDPSSSAARLESKKQDLVLFEAAMGKLIGMMCEKATLFKQTSRQVIAPSPTSSEVIGSGAAAAPAPEDDVVAK